MASHTWPEVKMEPKDDDSLYGGTNTSVNAADAARDTSSTNFAEGVVVSHPPGEEQVLEHSAVNTVPELEADRDHLMEELDAETQKSLSTSETEKEMAPASPKSLHNHKEHDGSDANGSVESCEPKRCAVKDQGNETSRQMKDQIAVGVREPSHDIKQETETPVGEQHHSTLPEMENGKSGTVGMTAQEMKSDDVCFDVNRGEGSLRAKRLKRFKSEPRVPRVNSKQRIKAKHLFSAAAEESRSNEEDCLLYTSDAADDC